MPRTQVLELLAPLYGSEPSVRELSKECLEPVAQQCMGTALDKEPCLDWRSADVFH